MKLLKIILYLGILIILFFVGVFIARKQRDALSKFVKPKDIQTTIVEKPIYKTYKVPILTYHYIEYPTNPDDTIRKGLTVLPSNFEAQILNLKNADYKFITPFDLYLALKGKKEIPEKSVIITFDDGYRDFYTDAYPIIKKYEIPVTVFMATGLVNQPNYLTYEQIMEILKNGYVEFGSHSWSHKNLTMISDKELIEEIYNGKEYFEKTYKVKLRYFAYPYGAYNEKVEDMVKNAGFMLAASMVGDGTKVHTLGNLYHLPRLKIGNVINLVPYFPK